MQYHLLNVVKVAQPRWHDRVILPKLDKFKPGWNILTINHKNYPSKYIIHSNKLLNYPTEIVYSKYFGDYQVKVIPLDDLVTIQEHEQDYNKIFKDLHEIGWM